MLRQTDRPMTTEDVDQILARALLVFARRGEQILRERVQAESENRPTLGSGGDSQDTDANGTAVLRAGVCTDAN